jgi:putative membrane protein
MTLLFHWALGAIGLLITTQLIPGTSITLAAAVIAAVVLGALNLFIRPLLILLTLPITIVTLGLFSFVINALLIWFTASVVPGFIVPSFTSALLFALVLTIINWVFMSWQY